MTEAQPAAVRTRATRVAAGAVVFVALASVLLLRVFWGADRADAALDRGFAALATAVKTPLAAPRRAAAFAAATQAFSDASGNALAGNSLAVVALELTVRIDSGDRVGLVTPLPTILDHLALGQVAEARAAWLAARDSGALAVDATSQTLVSEFLQRLFEKLTR